MNPIPALTCFLFVIFASCAHAQFAPLVKKPHIPKYMLELYSRVLHHETPPTDIIRSYSNLDGVNFKDYDDLVNRRETERGSHTRMHTLVFHVQQLPVDEHLEKGELRLLALIRRHQHAFLGVERRVSVSSCYLTDDGDSCHVVDDRIVYKKVSTWEIFNVTDAVQRWLKDPGREQRLEVRIEIMAADAMTSDDELDVPVEPYEDTEPLLLIYSSEKGKKEKHAVWRRSIEMEETEEESNMISEYEPAYQPKVVKGARRRHRNPCRRRSLYINFADINYDTWILAPSGYEAYECTGKCYFPLSDHLTPTKHAIMQTLLHTVAPKKASRACCVPTKLDPISVLYVENNESVTFKFHYEDMVVAECGCR